MDLVKTAPIVFAFAAFIALTLRAPDATASDKVKVQLLVIEASKAKKPSMPKDIRPEIAKQIQSLGFTVARVTDRLETEVEREASFSLELRDKSEKRVKRTVRVTVVKKLKDKILLRVQVPSLKNVDMVTEHKKGGSVLIAARKADDKALFIAVTPIPEK